MSDVSADTALQDARDATQLAENRLEGLRETIGKVEDRLEELEQWRQEAYAEGDDEQIRECREESRRLKAELGELRDEVPIAEREVRRRKREEDRAALRAVEARRNDLREEARQLGEEIRDHLEEVEELYEELQSVVDTDDTQRKRRQAAADRLPPDEPGGSEPKRAKAASGFSGQLSVLDGVVEYLTGRRVEQDISSGGEEETAA